MFSKIVDWLRRFFAVREDLPAVLPKPPTGGAACLSELSNSNRRDFEAPSEQARYGNPRVRPLSRPEGQLRHRRVYRFGVSQSGQTTTRCQVCGDRHSMFSLASDEGGKILRCCVRCLRRWGGDEQLTLATRRSRYLRRVSECVEALDELVREFPDPARRPYGEKSLRSEIEFPYFGYESIERIIDKIKRKRWTEYDQARIEGRPEPEQGSK